MGKVTIELESKLINIKIDPITDCHIWQGPKNSSGYGHICIEDKMELVHRIIYSKHSNIPLNMLGSVLHLPPCDNKLCCNIKHLYIGTAQDNALDMVKMGTNYQKRKTHCPQGHEYTSKNTYNWQNKRICRACLYNREAKKYSLHKQRNEEFLNSQLYWDQKVTYLKAGATITITPPERYPWKIKRRHF